METYKIKKVRLHGCANCCLQDTHGCIEYSNVKCSNGYVYKPMDEKQILQEFELISEEIFDAPT